jgi:hypothetical protein
MRLQKKSTSLNLVANLGKLLNATQLEQYPTYVGCSKEQKNHLEQRFLKKSAVRNFQTLTLILMHVPAEQFVEEALEAPYCCVSFW